MLKKKIRNSLGVVAITLILSTTPASADNTVDNTNFNERMKIIGKEVRLDIVNNPAFSDLDSDEKDDLLLDVNILLAGNKKDKIIAILEEYDFSTEDANKIGEKVPEVIAKKDTVSTAELIALVNFNIDDAIAEYRETGDVTGAGSFIKEDIIEIVSIIKEGEAADARYDKANARYDKANARYDKANARYDKANARYDKANARYNEAKELNRRIENIKRAIRSKLAK